MLRNITIDPTSMSEEDSVNLGAAISSADREIFPKGQEIIYAKIQSELTLTHTLIRVKNKFLVQSPNSDEIIGTIKISPEGKALYRKKTLTQNIQNALSPFWGKEKSKEKNTQYTLYHHHQTDIDDIFFNKKQQFLDLVLVLDAFHIKMKMCLKKNVDYPFFIDNQIQVFIEKVTSLKLKVEQFVQLLSSLKHDETTLEQVNNYLAIFENKIINLQEKYAQFFQSFEGMEILNDKIIGMFRSLSHVEKLIEKKILLCETNNIMCNKLLLKAQGIIAMLIDNLKIIQTQSIKKQIQYFNYLNTDWIDKEIDKCASSVKREITRTSGSDEVSSEELVKTLSEFKSFKHYLKKDIKEAFDPWSSWSYEASSTSKTCESKKTSSSSPRKK